VVGHDKENNRLLLNLAGRSGWIDVAQAHRYNPKELPPLEFAALGAKLPVSLQGQNPPEGEIPLRLEVGPQAALVALDPHTGQLLAIVGGDLVTPGGFDRATGAKRQPGSAFKPFVYLAAIATGQYTAATLLDDAPEVHGEWQPKNSRPDEFAGSVRLRVALARSLNLPAVKVAADIGAQAIADMASRLGITSSLDPTPALALGSSAISPLELASAYGVFAALGKRSEPWVVQSITGPGGKPWPIPGRSATEVLPPFQAGLMNSLLLSVVQEGTGSEARALGRPVAGKTGTSNEQKDAWFGGYTAQISCVVWVGYDDLRSIGKAEYGAKAALPIWLAFMKAAHEDLPKEDFPMPEGLVHVKIDPQSGLLAYEDMEGAMDELFIDGTEPLETAVPPELVAPSDFLLEQAAGPLNDAEPLAEESNQGVQP
jgi:penicillin-binding protein 1A